MAAPSSGRSNLYASISHEMSTSSGSRVRRLGTIAMSSNPYARRPVLPIPISTSTLKTPPSRPFRTARKRPRYRLDGGGPRSGTERQVGEETREDARGRAPHRLPGNLVEVDRPVAAGFGVEQARVDVPQLLTERSRFEQFRQRDVENPNHLAVVGVQFGTTGEQTDERREREARLHREQMVELGDDLDLVGREPDLLVRLAQRGGGQVRVDRL